MNTSFFYSSVGKKVIMAATGLLLTGFLLGHMAGNLQIFAGREKLNHYAETLKNLGPFLWIARASLLFFIIIHVKLALQLKIENLRARPVAYQMHKSLVASPPSRLMIYTGSMILVFLTYHLLHYTFGISHPEFYNQLDASGNHDVYAMVILSFQNPLISGIYILAMLLLSFHLYHGIESAFQSLGIMNINIRKTIKTIGIFISLILFFGNISIPISILLGYINL